jgi:hypothetical protein
MGEKQLNTSSASNLKRWNGTTHSGQSTASCMLQKIFIAAHFFLRIHQYRTNYKGSQSGKLLKIHQKLFDQESLSVFKLKKLRETSTRINDPLSAHSTKKNGIK